MEERILNIIWSKSGSGSPTTKLSIPIYWLYHMGMSKEDRKVIVKFNYETNEINIKKYN